MDITNSLPKLFQRFECRSGSLRRHEAQATEDSQEYSLFGASESFSRGFYENVTTWNSQTRISERRSQENVFTRIEDVDSQKNLRVSLQRDFEDPKMLNLVVTNPAAEGDGEVVLPFSRLEQPQRGTNPVPLSSAASDLWLVRDADATQMGFTSASGARCFLTVDAGGVSNHVGIATDDWTNHILSNTRPL